MQGKALAVLLTAALCCSLAASPIPGEPSLSLDSAGTVDIVFVYAIGEWSEAAHTHHYDQDTPLPDWALDIFGTEPPSIVDYYDEVSQGRFQVNPTVWAVTATGGIPEGSPLGDGPHYPYVMTGEHTPANSGENYAFNEKVIERIDLEDEFSFADHVMWYDIEGDDDPYVWMFIIYPDIYNGGWGVADDSYTWELVDEYVQNPRTLQYEQVRVRVFGVSRQPSDLIDDAVAGVVHEFNHQWFPDVGYNTDHYGLGGFDPQGAGLMFRDAQGAPPPPLNPVWRVAVDWMDETLVTGYSLDQTIQDQTAGEVYKFQSSERNDFYISAHRYQSYYERNWPGEGVMIWQADPVGTKYGRYHEWMDSNYLHKPIDLKCAHGQWNWNGFNKTTPDPVAGRDNLDVRGYYEQSGMGFTGKGDSSCFFWPDYGYTQFDGLTNPCSREFIRYHEDLGLVDPQKIAVRNIKTSAQPAMVTDLLSDYCIGSSQLGYQMNFGRNNQRSIHYNGGLNMGIGMIYTDNGLVYLRNSGNISSSGLDLRFLVDAEPIPVGSGNMAVYPAVYGGRVVYTCWLEGYDPYYNELYYRYGTLDSELGEIDTWHTGVVEISAGLSFAGFSPPSIVVSGDSVFIAVGEYQSIPFAGQSSPAFGDPLVALCFRFHKDNPQNPIVDTIGIFDNPGPGVNGGPTVALCVDGYDRVHATFTTTESGNQVLGHVYYVPGAGSWTQRLIVTPSTQGFTGVGTPGVEFVQDAAPSLNGTLYIVGSSYHTDHPTCSEIYRIAMPVTSSGPGILDLDRVTNTGTNSTEPVIAGGGKIFWNEGGEILYNGYNTADTVSRTPHLYSKNPQAIYAEGKYHLAWKEDGAGSEIDVRTGTYPGLGSDPYSSGGQSGGRSTTPMEIVLSSMALNEGKIRIQYHLPATSKDADLSIYDCQGRLIRSWSITETDGSVEWNGCDQLNRKMNSGVYFIRLDADGEHTESKIVKIK